MLDDADVGRAAAGAVRACFSNAGQLCVPRNGSTSHEPSPRSSRAPSCADRALRLGRLLDYEYDMGSLINTAQLERVEAHVEDARAKGATVLTGGRRRPDLGPLFYEPTVLTGVTPGDGLLRRRDLRPGGQHLPGADDAEAIARANDSEYGLNASVWTADPDRGRRVAEQLRCGTVNVNEGFAATFGSIDAPMGGMKKSGLGRRQGRDGIRRFVEVQSIGTQSGIPIAPSHGLGPEVLHIGDDRRDAGDEAGGSPLTVVSLAWYPALPSGDLRLLEERLDRDQHSIRCAHRLLRSDRQVQNGLLTSNPGRPGLPGSTSPPRCR